MNIPTALALLEANQHKKSTIETMIEFAKLHCIEQAKIINEKATMNISYPDEAYKSSEETGLSFVSAHEVERGGEYGGVKIDENSILNAYDLNLIN